MKKIFFPIVLLLIIHSVAFANTYYVAVNGNDANAGTITAPWGTWQKAFETANAGDTVFFRGGVWYPTTYTNGNAITIIAPNHSFIWEVGGSLHGHDGTANNPICYFNYPGEVPILDCSRANMGNRQYNVGISIWNADFLRFKGLTVRNVEQPRTPNSIGDYSPAAGIGLTGTTNLVFENMTVHDIGGRGFGGNSLLGFHEDPGYDTTRFINVDVYNCNDKLSIVPGNMADAYKIILQSNFVTDHWTKVAGLPHHPNPNGVIPHYYLTGCRSWNCADDGSDIGGTGTVHFDKCWFFSNGNETSIDGNGLKLGSTGDSINANIPLKVVTNCLMVNNTGIGIFDLQYEPYMQNNSRIYNNFLYKNSAGIQTSLADRYDTIRSIFCNNILYAPTDIDAAGRPQQFIVNEGWYEEHNNTFDFWEEHGSLFWWQPASDVTVTDDDFVSLDISQLYLPRKADGSLPDISLGRLAEGSDLIDMGYNVGLPFLGSAPDIGAFEYFKIYKEEMLICGGSYKGHTTSGTYVETLRGSGGSDSVISTKLTVVQPYSHTDTITIRTGKSYKGHTTTGTYVENLIGYQGCDSIVTTILTVSNTSTNELVSNFDNEITVSPNPTLGIVKIDFKSEIESNFNVDVADITGRLLQTNMKNNLDPNLYVDLTSYSAGLYFIRIYNSAKYYELKVIKQ